MSAAPPKNTEIERKFLIDRSLWLQSTHRDIAERYPIKQGYICTLPQTTVRVRVKGEKAYLTLKGPVQGITRSEFEYSIPIEDAEQLLINMTEFRIIKTRFVFTFEGYTWEVDEFEGEQAPLIIAEVELSHSEESPTIPPFIKDDVSHDMRYTNSQLAQNPFSRW